MTSDEASALAREIAEAIEQDMPDLVVSRMAKVLRARKVFIDWSQNNGSKTTIAPVLVARPGPADRGRAAHLGGTRRSGPAAPGLPGGAGVAGCRRRTRCRDWNPVTTTAPSTGSQHAAGQSAAAGRTPQKLMRPTPSRSPTASSTSTGPCGRPSKTPEPVPEPGYLPHGNDDTFVIQEHHARRLHYDFRLERGGVLVSWAVPKNIPPDTGQNRLAVQTEDHPLDYADFAGIIPRGEYGGGTVSIWDAGTYVTEKWRDNEIMIMLHGQRAQGRYVLIRTKDNSWLMHRMKDQSPEGPDYLRERRSGRQERADIADDGPETAAPAGRPSQPNPSATKGSQAHAGHVRRRSPTSRTTAAGGSRASGTASGRSPRSATPVCGLQSRAGNDFTHAYPELQVLTELLAGHNRGPRRGDRRTRRQRQDQFRPVATADEYCRGP